MTLSAIAVKYSSENLAIPFQSIPPDEEHPWQHSFPAGGLCQHRRPVGLLLLLQCLSDPKIGRSKADARLKPDGLCSFGQSIALQPESIDVVNSASGQWELSRLLERSRV